MISILFRNIEIFGKKTEYMKKNVVIKVKENSTILYNKLSFILIDYQIERTKINKKSKIIYYICLS